MKHEHWHFHFHGHGHDHDQKLVFDWAIGLATPKTTTRKNMDISITNEQKVLVTVTPVTAAGKPAKLDGKPTWTVSVGDSTIQPADDGMSCELISSDTPGDTTIVVSADADLGAGVVTVSDAVNLTVVGAMATSLGLTVGTPETK